MTDSRFILMVMLVIQCDLLLASEHSTAIVHGQLDEIVLYAQLDNAGTDGVPNQNFEPGFDAFDSTGADDFEIIDPRGWTLTEVYLEGIQQQGGLAEWVNLTILDDADGRPDISSPRCDYQHVQTTQQPASGNLVTRLPISCYLPGPARYWLAHQTDQAFANGNGQHFWTKRNVVSGQVAHWRNPNGGFETPCATFMDAGGVCEIGGGPPSFDLVYELTGRLGQDVDAAIDILSTPLDRLIGSQYDYVLIAGNNGPGQATGVQVVASLPPQLAYRQSDCPMQIMGDQITWPLAGLAANQSAVCRMTVEIIDFGQINLGVQIGLDQFDPLLVNNVDQSVLGGAARPVPIFSVHASMCLVLLIALTVSRKHYGPIRGSNQVTPRARPDDSG